MHTRHKHTLQGAATAILMAFFGYGNLSTLAQAAGSSPQNSELRQIINGLTIEGLSLTQSPEKAHETLVTAGFQVHSGNEPGHGIYWKNDAKRSTTRIRLKSSTDRIYQIQLSFAERGGDQGWQSRFDKIRRHLGTATRLCDTATEQELNCLLVSESPTQLSAEITTSRSPQVNRIKVRLDQRMRKISIKSNLSFGSPKKP